MESGWYKDRNGIYRYLIETTVFGMIKYRNAKDEIRYCMPGYKGFFSRSEYIDEDKHTKNIAEQLVLF